MTYRRSARAGMAWFALLGATVVGCGQLLGLDQNFSDVSGGTGGGSSHTSSSQVGTGGRGGGGGGSGSGLMCQFWPQCQPGDKETCGNCGWRECGSDCTFGSCNDEGPCSPGDTQSCGGGGNCGTQTCSDACTWCPCPVSSCSNCSAAQSNTWDGCGSNGCTVCGDKLTSYPCYAANHPGCAIEPTCNGPNDTCSDTCPPPNSADACACSGGSGASDCENDGCSRCEATVSQYACYFINHPSCTAVASCHGNGHKASCVDGVCPPPGPADL